MRVFSTVIEALGKYKKSQEYNVGVMSNKNVYKLSTLRGETAVKRSHRTHHVSRTKLLAGANVFGTVNRTPGFG